MIKELNEKIDEFIISKTDSEENLKVHITRWILDKLGFDIDTFNYEHKLCRRRNNDRHADIYIPLGNDNSLFVETKVKI